MRSNDDLNSHLKWFYYSTYHPIGYLDPELTLRDYQSGLSIPDAIEKYRPKTAEAQGQTQAGAEGAPEAT